ncbi:MAG: pilin N-terminal domain-containing protein [Lachnospiraceae bacterium]|jgi:hypothetical protein|nr:pilin N-terminal domain-containing protein [Lachnospiraceae bacterium]
MKKILKNLMLLLLLAAAVYGIGKSAVSIYADTVAVPDVNSSAACSLTITIAVHDDSVTTTVSGEKLAIYKVASLATHGGSPDYMLTSDFASTGIKLAGMTVEQSISYAATLQSYVKEHGIINAGVATTGNGGIVKFSGLSVGIYLVTETGRTGDADNYNSLQPFLILVPQFSGNSWVYDVTAFPKIQQKKTDSSSKTTSCTSSTVTTASTTSTVSAIQVTSKVKTGDASNASFWTAVCAITVVLFLVVLIFFHTADMKT